MTRKPRKEEPQPLRIFRCAIYTRKSTEEGLDQEFNSLDAQRESAEAFIASQQHEGWTCLPDRYDDGGFSGGDTDRPGLQRLLKDIEAGKIDCVVVYKIDRFSRSLMDFASMMQTFHDHGVSFVAVTQRIDTSTSMGRLILNVLLSFAQFEREIISERTRDKIAATRRRGRWSGGPPVLGYDLDTDRSRLVVNEEEAIQVRQIFDLYLEHQSLYEVSKILEERGWVNKRWKTKLGHFSGGRPFSPTNLHGLLTNVIYLGKVRYKDEVHEGEHEAIVPPTVFERVGSLLEHNGRTRGAGVRDKFGAILKGLLHCSACDCFMSPSHSTREKTKRYRYYVCTNASKRGWHQCPARSIPATEIEEFVVRQIQDIGRDPKLLDEILSQARGQIETQARELDEERRRLQTDLTHWQSEERRLCGLFSPEDSEDLIDKLANLHERIRLLEQRAAKVRDHLESLQNQRLDEDEIRLTLSLFEPVWKRLSSAEQGRVLRLLIERIDYDATTSEVTITYHPTGLETLAEELSNYDEERTA